MAADLDRPERYENAILSLRDYYYPNGWRDQWHACHSLVTASRYARRLLFATNATAPLLDAKLARRRVLRLPDPGHWHQRCRWSGWMVGKKPLTVPSLIWATARLWLKRAAWVFSSASMRAMPITARAAMSGDSNGRP
jgi:hypothetical protein